MEEIFYSMYYHHLKLLKLQFRLLQLNRLNYPKMILPKMNDEKLNPR